MEMKTFRKQRLRAMYEWNSRASRWQLWMRGVGTYWEEGSEANYDAYKAFTRRLAERGFVTFAPHNPCESLALPVSLRVAGAAMRRVIPELGMQQPSGNTEA